MRRSKKQRRKSLHDLLCPRTYKCANTAGSTNTRISSSNCVISSNAVISINDNSYGAGNKCGVGAAKRRRDERSRAASIDCRSQCAAL